ncbi:Ribosomal protein S21 [Ceraceosorus bombacis]|uniref:Ribosomal protein S21 n=1 Tax=Ceraceosorus bombacis TaxID=401625 RepID=A0A0P1BSA7_9BASI|nr:Ribosomal protein S21 [Ceraceosorus bombacis]
MRSLIRATQALSLGNASSRCSVIAPASVSAAAKRHITSSAANPDIRGNYLGSAPKLDEREAQEDAWMTQRVYGNTRLVSPTTVGRTVVGQEDVSVALNMLKGILNRNYIRQQVFAGLRYEKPSKKRRRMRSVRHRRRFQDLVRKKVQLAMQIKATGA